ncbi:MAG TPA: hypothetical protein DGG94_13070 [Micromonosporaceae bacterium]|nr:hypothetical protein [Micromonosporaceae bacterium]HCU50712.1 hypothetical protein [Micromonosporaceae bacterium]
MRRPPAAATGWLLVTNNWNDYGYYTLFTLWHGDGQRAREIGTVKIGRLGMDADTDRRPEPPDVFEVLDEEFFSLGQDASYYEALRDLDGETGQAILRALRDVALDQSLFERVREEHVTRVSLLRSVQEHTATQQFHRIALGGLTLTPYRFSFHSPLLDNDQLPLRLTFAVEPASQPPTNIHVLIGSNGVGKTRLLNLLARAVADGGVTEAEVGTVTDDLEGSDRPFANMISVSFSAFDPFTPVRVPNGTAHAYLSLNRPIVDDAQPMPLKDHEALAGEFSTSMFGLTAERLQLWLQAIGNLESDPLFKDAEISSLAQTRHIGGSIQPAEVFQRLSSGHKIVLLTITRLADLVSERTLVLIDEPETHLHPPLLASFMRAVSGLLLDRNGVAIIATHSPVVLQETPRSCVWKIRRSGSLVTAERPEIETFGENVGILTREAFGLQVEASGHYRDLRTAVDEGLSFSQILDRFSDQLGAEAKGVVRALIAVRDQAGRG